VSKVADRTALVKGALAEMRACREAYYLAEDAYNRATEEMREAVIVHGYFPTYENSRRVDEAAAKAKRADDAYHDAMSEYSHAETVWVDAMRGESGGEYKL
jgi:hypothetical protein